MKSPSDPIRWLALQIATVIVIGAIGLGVLIWRLLPGVASPPLTEWTPIRPAAPQRDEAPLFDLTLFEKRLAAVVATPEVVVADVTQEPPPQPPPPFKIAYSLVGLIETTDGSLKAVVYDQEHDELVTVSQGESLGRFTVETVSPLGMALSQGDRMARLDLDPVEDSR